MHPPDPIFILKSGIRNMSDFAILWHLGLCGLTGAGLQQIADATALSYNTVATCLARMGKLKLTTETRLKDKPGHPLVFVISRMGYRLMTGHLQKQDKADHGGQLPLASEVVHTS